MDINERLDIESALAAAEDEAWEQYKLAFPSGKHWSDEKE